MGKQLNPALGERGYGVLMQLEWDIPADLLSYLIHDAHRLQPWSEADRQIFFTPEFMPRSWRVLNLKSQAEVLTPDEFFLRPSLEEDKFPGQRKIKLSPELRTRLQAQEEAGQLVFTTDVPAE